jgi:hypothetical protein
LTRQSDIMFEKPYLDAVNLGRYVSAPDGASERRKGEKSLCEETPQRPAKRGDESALRKGIKRPTRGEAGQCWVEPRSSPASSARRLS